MNADPLNAYARLAGFPIPGAAGGSLAGLTFAAKDLYDIQGMVTGSGNPDWAKSHGPADRTAPSVQLLLDAGASLTGKTHTDELAFSLNGENAHYGTPLNSACPDRIPGGSSSGSVSVVAAGAVDFALGTDTGGSVRVPSSYCGVFGIRTTHGRITKAAVTPLAESFDTVGWFARDPAILRRVGQVYFGLGGQLPARLLMGSDAFAELADGPRKGLAPALGLLESVLGKAEPVTIAPDGLQPWFLTFRTLQTYEAWAEHGAWIEATKPAFGSGIGERFQAGRAVTPDQRDQALAKRQSIRARMAKLLTPGTVLAIPSAPDAAPFRNTPAADLNDFRERAMRLTCIAGNAGLPQISLPLGSVSGCPIGLSLIGAPGSDLDLMLAAEATWAAR